MIMKVFRIDKHKSWKISILNVIDEGKEYSVEEVSRKREFPGFFDAKMYIWIIWEVYENIFAKVQFALAYFDVEWYNIRNAYDMVMD